MSEIAGRSGPDTGHARADELLRAYTARLLAAQASHSPWDWLGVGVAFFTDAVAAAAADRGAVEARGVAALGMKAGQGVPIGSGVEDEL